MGVYPTGPGWAGGGNYWLTNASMDMEGLRSSGLQYGLLMLQYTRSKCQETGIAQSVYVTQGFSPVTFATGTDGTMGTVEKKR